MAKYYALISGLPQLTAESPRPPFSTEEFAQTLGEELTKKDLALLQLLRSESEHRELIQWLVAGELPLPQQQRPQDYAYGTDEAEAETAEGLSPKLQALRQVAQEAYLGRGLSRKAKQALPDYQARFIHDLFFAPHPTELDQEPAAPRYSQLISDPLALEDLLASYYYKEMEQSPSDFIRSWAALNKNLRNILVIYTCRRLGWSADRFIVGEGPVEEKLRSSKAKDFDLSEELPYLPELLRIAEERDIARRERLIDLVKWRWMDDWTFVRIFDVDNVLCYYLRLQILERWSKLDPQLGESTFRSIVHALKGESAQVLQDFKRAQGHR